MWSFQKQGIKPGSSNKTKIFLNTRWQSLNAIDVRMSCFVIMRMILNPFLNIRSQTLPCVWTLTTSFVNVAVLVYATFLPHGCFHRIVPRGEFQSIGTDSKTATLRCKAVALLSEKVKIRMVRLSKNNLNSGLSLELSAGIFKNKTVT